MKFCAKTEDTSKTFQCVGDNYLFSVWCEIRRFQCSENLLDILVLVVVVVVVAAVRLGHK